MALRAMGKGGRFDHTEADRYWTRRTPNKPVISSAPGFVPNESIPPPAKRNDPDRRTDRDAKATSCVNSERRDLSKTTEAANEQLTLDEQRKKKDQELDDKIEKLKQQWQDVESILIDTKKKSGLSEKDAGDHEKKARELIEDFEKPKQPLGREEKVTLLIRIVANLDYARLLDIEVDQDVNNDDGKYKEIENLEKRARDLDDMLVNLGHKRGPRGTGLHDVRMKLGSPYNKWSNEKRLWVTRKLVQDLENEERHWKSKSEPGF